MNETNKNSKTGGYNLDGTIHNEPGHISPLYLITKEDESVYYVAGWYFCDEVEQLIGPFDKIEDAIDAFKKYVP